MKAFENQFIKLKAAFIELKGLFLLYLSYLEMGF